MVDSPATCVEIGPSVEFSVVGPYANRVKRIVERVITSGLVETAPLCAVHVVECPPPHTGLGGGTQLTLAIGRGLIEFAKQAPLSGIEIANRLERARRSAVGSYGFDQGGLIVEAGRHERDAVSPLIARVELPTDWRFVLVRPRFAVGLSGGDEERAFGSLTPVPVATTDQLCREALLELVPAARLGDFERFGRSMERFGQLAGSCFAAAQLGTFASAEVERIVARIHALGFHGVAQSSWGPTIAAAMPSEVQAHALISELSRDTDSDQYEVQLTRPNNTGATVASS
jgi:beta-RFAP synthase